MAHYRRLPTVKLNVQKLLPFPRDPGPMRLLDPYFPISSTNSFINMRKPIFESFERPFSGARVAPRKILLLSLFALLCLGWLFHHCPPHTFATTPLQTSPYPTATMADEDEIAALVIDNGSGMCKGGCVYVSAAVAREGRGGIFGGSWVWVQAVARQARPRPGGFEAPCGLGASAIN